VQPLAVALALAFVVVSGLLSGAEASCVAYTYDAAAYQRCMQEERLKAMKEQQELQRKMLYEQQQQRRMLIEMQRQQRDACFERQRQGSREAC
jgi:uncharacterized membrane protein